MFLGTIPEPMRSIVAETVASWPAPGALHVPCCGNFTIERALAGTGWRVHSSDVSIYTSALGRWLTGQPTGVTLRPESETELGWLADGLDDAAGTVATLMLGTRFLEAVGKDTAYHRRLVDAYRQAWPRLHAETVEKLKRADVPLASYEARDIRDVIDQAGDDPVCTFPPFYAGGYERMWRPLDEHFAWDAPSYQPLTLDDVHDVIERLAARPHWLVATNQPLDSLAGYHRGTVKTTPRAAAFHVYAGSGHSRVIAPRQVIEPVTAPRLRPGDRVGDHLALAPLTMGQFNALRSQYLNPRIPPGSGDLACAVTADGTIVGVVCFYMRPAYDPHGIYLLSDFAVAPTSEPRLSKLVLLAATTSEARRLVQRIHSRRIGWLSTTAFSDRPVSMKYRGVLKLTSRNPSKDPAFRWMLNYEGPLGERTLDEALTYWRDRWAVAA